MIKATFQPSSAVVAGPQKGLAQTLGLEVCIMWLFQHLVLSSLETTLLIESGRLTWQV